MSNANDKLLEMRLIDIIMDQRTQFRKDKDWPLTDKYRKGLETLGIEIADAKDGTSSWKYKDKLAE